MLGAYVFFQIIGTRNYFNTGEITALFDAEGRGQEQSKSTCYRRERGEDYCVSVWGERELTSGGGVLVKRKESPSMVTGQRAEQRGPDPEAAMAVGFTELSLGRILSTQWNRK